MALAEKHGLMVIEDAAEAHGAEYKGRRTGGLGDAAGFSFYGNKIITTGEGGMVTTNNRELAQLAWNLRDHAFSHERHFWHKFVGFNYRMTNLQAAVGLAQVEQLDGFVAARRRNAAEYNCRLHGIPGIRTPAEAPWAKNVYWMYGIMVDEAEYGMGRDAAAPGAGRPRHRDAHLLHPHALPAGLLAAVQGRALPGGRGSVQARLLPAVGLVAEHRRDRVRGGRHP